MTTCFLCVAFLLATNTHAQKRNMTTCSVEAFLLYRWRFRSQIFANLDKNSIRTTEIAVYTKDPHLLFESRLLHNLNPNSECSSLVQHSITLSPRLERVPRHVHRSRGLVAVCRAAVVDSVQAAQALRGCTVIEGYLEIQIRGGRKYRRHLSCSALLHEQQPRSRVLSLHSFFGNVLSHTESSGV